MPQAVAPPVVVERAEQGNGRRYEVRLDAGGAGCPAGLAARLGLVPLGAFETLVAALPAGCSVLRVELQAGASAAGLRLEASDGGEYAPCMPGQECPVGGCRFPATPVERRSAGGSLALVIFESTAAAPRSGAVSAPALGAP